MTDYKTVFCRDIQKLNDGEKVHVTGVITKRWVKRQSFGIEIKDLTGTIRVRFSDAIKQFDKKEFQVGKRIHIQAETGSDKQKNRCLKCVSKVEWLEEINQFTQELDIMEQESLVALSKISNLIRERLEKKDYVEVDTRIISRYLGEELLEPLLAEYPGFGTPAFLTPSPSSQLSEFLAVTLLPRVFTKSISLTTTYRFRSGSTEMPIIMSKAINLSEEEIEEIIVRISQAVLESISGRDYKLERVKDEWNDELSIESNHKEATFVYGIYAANIPSVGRKWNSIVQEIRRLEDDKGNLLVESAIEKVSDTVSITTVTFYPSQYLNWASRAPKRQLLNLWKVYDGGNMYG